jgi:hypothetical protein
MTTRDEKVDVLIATPGHSAKMEYVKSLIATCAELDRLGLTYRFISRYSSFVPTARELTALDKPGHDYSENVGVAGGVEYGKLFWIDSDIEWEPEDFMRLYNSNLDVVSGLYVLDTAGTVAVNYPNLEGVPTRVNKVEFLLHEEPVEVGGVGFGFVCVKSGVFEKMQRPWFLINRVRWSLETEMRVNVGEDYSWCANASRAGFKIFVDPLVKVRHHKETIYEV